jgi:hypothetical protein
MEQSIQQRNTHEQDERMACSGENATLLPSQRAPTPPPPDSEEASFLANLNEVYGEEPQEDEVIEGIRRTMRTVLDPAS